MMAISKWDTLHRDPAINSTRRRFLPSSSWAIRRRYARLCRHIALWAVVHEQALCNPHSPALAYLCCSLAPTRKRCSLSNKYDEHIPAMSYVYISRKKNTWIDSCLSERPHGYQGWMLFNCDWLHTVNQNENWAEAINLLKSKKFNFTTIGKRSMYKSFSSGNRQFHFYDQLRWRCSACGPDQNVY